MRTATGYRGFKIEFVLGKYTASLKGVEGRLVADSRVDIERMVDRVMAKGVERSIEAIEAEIRSASYFKTFGK